MSPEPVRLDVSLAPEAARILAEIGSSDGLTLAEVVARFAEHVAFEKEPDEDVATPAVRDWSRWARYHRRLVAVNAAR